MGDCSYYFTTILIYCLAVLGSCVIPSVDLIFEFIGTVCVNFMSFLFPAFFYLKASSNLVKDPLIPDQSGTDSSASTPPAKSSQTLRWISVLQIVVGVVAFVLGMFNNIYGIMNHESE